MNKGTIWSFICPCGRDHERRRRVVSVDLLNEERSLRLAVEEAAREIVEIWQKPPTIDSNTDLDSAIDELASVLADKRRSVV